MYRLGQSIAIQWSAEQQSQRVGLDFRFQFTIHCPPAVGAIDDISPSVAVTEMVPIQPMMKDQTTAPGPPSTRAGTEVLRIASHEESAEQDNPRMDMNPKLRVSNGRLPSLLNVTSSLATRTPWGFVAVCTTVVSSVVLSSMSP